MAPVIDLIENGSDAYGRPEQPGDVLSPSQLTTWLACSQRWAFAKVWGIPEPTTAAAAFGTAMHEATGYAHRAQAETGAILPTPEVVEVWERAWREQLAVARLTARHDPDELAGRGAALLERYMTEVAPTLDPARIEMQVSGEIAGVAVRGRLDVVESDGRIRDTKTVCTKPQGMRTKDRLQATIYTMITPGSSGFVGLDYLVKTKGKPQVLPILDRVTHGDEAIVAKLLVEAQAGMRSGSYTPNRLCSSCNRLMCGYADVCETEYGGRVPQYPEAS